jgi:gamma-glutamyl:cysteine ligase YbdK (ATP-grasp superfamily)
MEMAKRRGNHEGSLYFYKARNRWCAQVSLNGHRITKYGKTRVECREWVKEMLAKINAGLTYEGTQFTLQRFIEIWLNGKELSRRPKTVIQYKQVAA